MHHECFGPTPTGGEGHIVTRDSPRETEYYQVLSNEYQCRHDTILNLEYGPQSSPHACTVQARIQAPKVKLRPSRVTNDYAATKRLRLETKPRTCCF